MIRTLLAVLLCAGSTAGLAAHHDISPTFDESRIVEVRGIVTRVQWKNPHTVIEIQATDRTGKTTTWLTETQSYPSALLRRGWSPTSVTEGASVVVRGFAERQRTGAQPPALVIVAVTLADGTMLDASSSGRWRLLK